MEQTRLSQAIQLGVFLLLLAVAIQLGGIWNELRHIRREQVKNAYYSLPKEAQAALTQSDYGDAIREMEGEVAVTEIAGTVDVDVKNDSLDVDVQNPSLDVDVGNQPIEVEVSH